MLRSVLLLASFAGCALALTPALPWVDVANAMRAALDGEPLVNRTSVVSNGKAGITVRIEMLPCPTNAPPACRAHRARRSTALATLLYLAREGRGDAGGTFDVKAEVVLNGATALRGPAPTTAQEAVDLLKGALISNMYFSRVWDRTVPPAIPGLDWISVVFKPKIIQYSSTSVLGLEGLTTLPAAQVFSKVFYLEGLSSFRIRASLEEEEARADSNAWFRSRLATIGPGAAFYSDDHSLTKRAEALRDEFLAAAQTAVEQRHGPSSRAAQRLRKRLAAGPPAVRVFSCSDASIGGFCGAGGIAVSNSEGTMARTMAHEVAHFILQHNSEAAAIVREGAWIELLAVLGGHAAAPTLPRGRLPALPVASTAAGRTGDSPRWRLLLENADTALQGDEQLPLLRPGHHDLVKPTRQALASLAVHAELEADQLGMLLFASTGRDPRWYVMSRYAVHNAGLPESAVRWSTDRLCAALEAAAQKAEARSPGSLTAITAADSDFEGVGIWPNEAKQLQNFARHLPAAMAVYEAQQSPREASWSSWLRAWLPSWG
ncbi:hypothetical protein ABPG75_010224 [Micractinium tetrahymenae]